jgi:thiaminase/transcriptional activator TenA
MTEEKKHAQWASGRDDARFSEWLRQRTEPTWTRATTHRFTTELADGTLADAVMRRYLVQDYSFLDSFVTLLASAIGKAPSLADRIPLCQFLGVVTSAENTYFQRAFEALAVPAHDRVEPVLHAPTRGFHALMAEAVRSEGYAETLAPLVVFEWLYLTWASAVADRAPQAFYHAEWITLHADPAFARFVDWLRGQLDSQGPRLTDDRRDRVAALFRRAVELELAFFDEAYRED